MKKIQFNKVSPIVGITEHKPTSATKTVPNWFRGMERYIGGELKIGYGGSANETVKACPPFLDSMMSGYMLVLEFDLAVDIGPDGEPTFSWRAGGEVISTHAKDQITKEQIPEGYSSQPYKFTNLWQVVTPPGYSTLFMHPLNRTDLPFHTLSGIVETDTYKSTVNFPFLIKKDFVGIIPAGTPIAQLFPLKRESWQSSFGEVDQNEYQKNQIKLTHKILNSYKSQWWQRKDYR